MQFEAGYQSARGVCEASSDSLFAESLWFAGMSCEACGSDCSEQSEAANGSMMSLGQAKWSVSTYPQSDVRMDVFEDKNFERAIFRDSQRCVRSATNPRPGNEICL